MEQDSMTPPSSPLVQAADDIRDHMITAETKPCVHVEDCHQLEDRISEKEYLLFSCVKKDRENGFSVLKSCHLEKFIGNDVSHLMTQFTGPTVELFGSHFPKCTAVFHDMDVLFNLAKMYISKMEMQENSKTGSDLVFIRQNLQCFFDYVMVSLKLYSDTWNEESHVISLLNHLKSLHLYIGGLHEVNLLISSKTGSWNHSEWDTVLYHLFHMYLEIHWRIVQVTHCISLQFPGKLNTVNLCSLSEASYPVEGDLMWQVVSLLVWDIVLLAIEKYKQVNHHSLVTSSCFQCSCVGDLLIMLRHLLTHRQQSMAKESFMVLLQPIVFHIVKSATKESMGHERMEVDECDSIEKNSDLYPLPPEFSCDDALGFCWWFIMHIVPTFLYDVSGSLAEQKLDRLHCQSFDYILQQLARKSVATTETKLRNYLQCCLQLAPYIDTNMQVVSIFWDHFYKKLNETYSVTVPTLGNLPSINKSALGLLEMTEKIVLSDPISQENASSFVLFLHLVCLELQKSPAKGPSNPGWKAMKGRFYSKFHSRRMQELTELGLQHFALLFLCLAQVADREDVVQKMCDLYSTLNVGRIGTPKRSAIWRGCFATILLYVRSNTDISFLAEKIAASFNAVCSELMQPDSEPSLYSELWTLIDLYMEGAQDVIELSENLSLSQHKLLPAGFADLLKICKEHHLRGLLNFAQTVLTKYRLLKHRQAVVTSYSSHRASDLSDNLWKYFYPFIKEHATTLTPPPQLADLAAGFTLFLLDTPSGHSVVKDSLVQCFGFFSWSETVNAKVTCRYLGHLLPNQQVLDHLSRVVPNLEVKLLQSWVKCCFEIKASDEGITELTRLIMKMPAVSGIVGGEVCSQDTDLATSTFFRSLGNKYAALADLKSKTEFREKVASIFSEVPKCLNVLLKTCTSPDVWNNVYRMSGLMVRDCASLIYLKSKPDCLLPILIDKLALPRALVVQNKPLPSHIIACLKEHLYLFVQGLAKLDYKRDAYVQRKLKDIVIHYIPKFPVGCGGLTLSVTSVHPLLMALGDTFSSEVTEDSKNFRKYLVNVIKTEYLSLRGTTVPQHAGLSWVFILDLIGRTSKGEVISGDAVVLLKTTLDYMLTVDSGDLRTNATKVMQQLIENVSRNAAAVDVSVLHSIVRNFFQSYIKVYQNKVMKVLEIVAAFYPDMFVPLITMMTESIKASEAKRGVGIDKQLRMSYYSLLCQLGEAGNEEKMRLLREAT